MHVLSEQRFWQVLTFSMVLVLYAGMEVLGSNGLIAVLGFGLTISNFPGLDAGPGLTGSISALADSQQALLTFHSELAFLVRSFFFVLIGAIAQLGIFRQHPLLVAGTLGALFIARVLAIQASRWSWQGIGVHGQEAILWMLPRGLITVVLAIAATEARSKDLAFFPGLAFAVILATNLLLVFGSWRAHRPATAKEIESEVLHDAGIERSCDVVTVPASAARTSLGRRWVINAALLVLLAFGAFVWWYGNQPTNVRKVRMKNWLRQHLHASH